MPYIILCKNFNSRATYRYNLPRKICCWWVPILRRTVYYKWGTALPMKNMTYSAETSPILRIRSNNRAWATRVDTVCHPIDEAEVSVTIAVMHTGEVVPYARTAPCIAKSLSALAATGHCRITAIHESPCVEFSCTGQRSAKHFGDTCEGRGTPHRYRRRWYHPRQWCGLLAWWCRAEQEQ